MQYSKITKQDSVLGQLQSREQLNLLEAIDGLRFANLSAKLKLPQLIVCGDTSSGKSSVLEGISGVRFPTSQKICTRFASELRLRPEAKASFNIHIKPAESRNAEDRTHLESFGLHEPCTDLHQFPNFITSAAAHMEKVANGAEFFEDTLVADVRGPGLPLLTLVDLPGLIHASGKKKKDIATVRRIVKDYMSQPKAIVLAVVAADNDFANQAILQMVKEQQSAAHRTIGILTKPDNVASTSPLGSQAIECAKSGKNDFVTLHYGWHLLKNRDYESRNSSLEDRDARETEFFQRNEWSSVPHSNRGASVLRTKLSKILFREIRSNLPTIIQDLKSRIDVCKAEAKLLGNATETEVERREQLTRVSRDLHELVDAATRGSYTTYAFFDEDSDEEISPRRLRACLRNYLKAFSTTMHNDGVRVRISETGVTADNVNFTSHASPISEQTITITLDDLRQSLRKHIKHNLGTEAPGTLPPSIYASVLSFLCSKWEMIAMQYAQGCWQIAKDFFTMALAATSPPHVAAAIVNGFVLDHFDRAEKKVMDKLQELLKPYRNRSFFMLNQLEAKEEMSSEDVLKWAGEAYDIALNTFIDNFSTLAIEFCLVEDLHQVFTAVDIPGMTLEQVEELTKEPEHVTEHRLSNNKELKALHHAWKICNQQSSGVSTSAPVPVPKPEPQTTTMPTATTPQTFKCEADVKPQTHIATAEMIAKQVESFKLTPPSPGPDQSSEALDNSKKAMPGGFAVDVNVLTPPRTPSRGSNGPS